MIADYEEPICHVPPIQERASDGGNAVSQDYEAMGLVHTYMSPVSSYIYVIPFRFRFHIICLVEWTRIW